MSLVSQVKDKVTILTDRAEMFRAARDFFHNRGVIEVDCPMMSPTASVDLHIDLIKADDQYLHSSPEYGMKKLLAEGMGDIYQLSHVFRDGEHSTRHRPEFMLVEWYRMGFNLNALIEETVDFVRLFIGDLSFSQITYREAFKKYTGIDYVHANEKELLAFLHENNLDPYENIQEEGKDGLLNFILSVLIQPHLGHEEICVLTHYPASQAALAMTHWEEDEQVAERFEIFYQGLELANGYHELADAKEQLKRFEEANLGRQRLGKNALPIDIEFIKALEKGLPDCCGVAVGFDRLMMLRHQTDNIADVLPIPT